MNNILLGILVVAGIMIAAAYASTSIGDVSHASTQSNQIDIEKKSESMHVFFDGDKINVKNTGKYDLEIAMFRFYNESGTEVHRTIIPDTDGRVFGETIQIVKDTTLTSNNTRLQSHIPNSYSLEDIGINSIEGLTGEIVTKRGRAFPIILESNFEKSENGTSILDALGVSLAIQNINTNGKVHFGYGDNPGSQTDIRQYVGVGPNDDWVIAITDDDAYEIIVVPELGKQYQYSSGTLIETSSSSNILGYSESIIISGSPNISINSDGVTFSGTGKIIAKINNMADVSTILRTDIPSGSSIQVVKSPYDLFSILHDSRGFQICSEGESAGGGDAGHYRHSHKVGGKNGRYISEWHTYYTQTNFSFTLNCEIGKDSSHTANFEYNRTYRQTNGGLIGPLSSLSTYTFLSYPGFTTSTGSQNLSYTVDSSGAEYSRIIAGTGAGVHGTYSGSVKIYDTNPTVIVKDYTSNIEEVFTFPSEQLYLLVEPNGQTVSISAQAFDPNSDVFFQVDGLLPDVAYDISKNGITGVLGKTSSSGSISLLVDDVDFGISTSPGGILKIYPDSAKYLGNFGIGMIDLYNGCTISLPTGEDLAYIPQNFVRWVFPVAVEAENIQVDDISLNCLNNNYTKNDALLIPVIPGANTIYATINDEDVEILMRDVATTTQIKHVPQKSSTSSDHSTSEAVSTTSNISTSTFLTATHTGEMSVNLDLKVGGSADFTMDSTYAGGFTSSSSCNWSGASSPYRTYSCRNYSTPSNPSGISNLNSLTSDHQSQLTTALNNGQVSQITVEVDIFKNLQYVKTELIYISNSAQASVISTLSEAGYGASNQVHVTYPLTSISENIAIPVDVGDMMEFVVRVNLEASGVPTPSSIDAAYSAYVKTTTEFGGGVITVAMSS